MEILKINKKQAPKEETADEKAKKEVLAKTPSPPKAKEDESSPEQPKSQEEQEKDTLREAGYYYQAIGWLYGLISKNEENKFQITLRDGATFILTANRNVMYALAKQFELEPRKPLWVRCYPQSRLQEQLLYFKVVNFQKEKPEDVQTGIFILRGIWQFIPQNKRPVFSIYRNQLRFPDEKIRNQHLPLIWKEERPFRFKKDSEDRPQFYQIEARLISRRACLGWVKTLAGAAKPPKRLRNNTNIGGNEGAERKNKGKGEAKNEVKTGVKAKPNTQKDKEDKS